MTIWSPQQDRALVEIADWMHMQRPDPYFFLGGYAGTGKTTLAKTITEGVDGRIHFVAYTGKAASVMRNSGCNGATTIHSLIYQPSSKSRAHLRQLEHHLNSVRSELIALGDQLTASGQAQKAILERDLRQTEENIEQEKENLKRPAFSLNLESELWGASLLVLDEASMVDEQTFVDLMSFDVPILALGDPAQLPPVYGKGFFTHREPHFMLTEVHRQALDSPVLYLATRVRQGDVINYGMYGDSAVVPSLEPGQVLEANQILVGMNTTRRASNRRVRQLKGLEQISFLPLADERVVCLRNNHELGLLNGTIFNTSEIPTVSGERLVMSVHNEERTYANLLVHDKHFLGRGQEIDQWERLDAEEFDYGYAMTVHKFQGSQDNGIVLFDEWFRDGRAQWLYTGLTRAKEWVKVVRR